MTSERQQLAAIETEKILPCMTCPICKRIFKNATTISECLHTFCKKCIYKKITKEDLHCCPVCKTDLGVAPLQKLRPDHSWQDLRAFLFNPSTKIKSKESKSGPSNPLPETIERQETDDVKSVPLPARRKKKSLSSLVGQPKASNATVMVGRKNPGPKKAYASRGTALTINEPSGKEDDRHKSSSPHLTLSKSSQYQKQSFHVGESSKQKMSQKGAEDSTVEPLEGMADMWKPLNCLMEAADATRRGNPPVPLPETRSVPSSTRSDKGPKNKGKSKDLKVHFKVGGEEGSHLTPSGSAEPKKRHVACDRGKSAQRAMVSAACNVGSGGVWFSLVASDSQGGVNPLQQIPAGYLRVKNADLPASYIQKYIVKKLNLQSEDEVEITMQGHQVPPDLLLRDLVGLWAQRAPKPGKIKATPGSSAEDYVMVICYGRKK